MPWMSHLESELTVFWVMDAGTTFVKQALVVDARGTNHYSNK